MIRLVLLALSLLLASNAVALNVGPERPLIPPRIVPVGGVATNPIVLSSPAGFFAVWTNHADVLGVRVTPDGRVLDPRPIVISFNLGGRNPAAVWNGNEWVVFWDAYLIPGLWIARIEIDGTIRQRTRIDDAPPSTQAEQVAAWNGRSYLIARSGSGGITARLFDPAGAKIDSIELAPEGTGHANPAVATSGSEFLIAWDEYFSSGSRIWKSRVSGSGDLLEPTAVAVAATRPQAIHPEPDVRWDGERYVMVWADRGVKSVDVTPNGVVIGLPREIYANGFDLQANPRLSIGETSNLLLWKAEQPSAERPEPARFDLFGSRLTRAMTAIESGRLSVLTMPAFESASPSAAASIGDRHLIVWIDRGVRAALIDPTERLEIAAADSMILSTFAVFDDQPILTGDGTNVLVVWVEKLPEGGKRLRAGRIAPNGVFLDGQGHPLASLATSYPANFDVAFDGKRYLVVWQDDDGSIIGRWLSRTAEPLDHVDIGRGSLPSTASNGESFLVAFQSASGPRVRTIAWRGLGEESAIGGHATVFDVVVSGSQYSVFLADSNSISVVRVTPAGAVRDPQPIPIVTSSRSVSRPRVASSDRVLLVAWSEQTNSTTPVDQWDLFGALLSPDGAVGNRFPLSTGSGEESVTSLAWTGSDFIAVWTHAKQTTERGWYLEIRGTRVPESGIVLQDPADSGALIAPSHFQFDLGGASVWSLSGRTLVIYPRQAREAFRDPSAQLFIRFIDFSRKRGARLTQ